MTGSALQALIILFIGWCRIAMEELVVKINVLLSQNRLLVSETRPDGVQVGKYMFDSGTQQLASQFNN